MTPDQIKALIQQEIAKSNSGTRFGLSMINKHSHSNTGADGPYVYLPYQLFAGFVPYDGDVNGVLESILPTGWTIFHPLQSITFTGSLSVGATSGTLTTAWTDAQAALYVLTIFFSNGDTATVTLTAGSTSVTWDTPLSSGATANAAVEAVGQYSIIHNLGTMLYSFVAVPAQSTNLVVSPVVSAFANQVDINWFDSSSTEQDTSFNFILMLLQGNSSSFPSYTTNNTTPIY